MANQEAINVVHDYKNRVDRYIEKIKKLKNPNSKKVLEHQDSLAARGLSIATQHKYIERLYSILQWTKKDFDKLTREELKEIVSIKVDKNKRLTDSTKITYKKILRKFFQWLKDCDDGEFPPEVSWIKTGGIKEQKHKQPEDLLTDEDIEKMIKVTEHPRDKAFLITLAESGCRIGEILTLKIDNINFDDKGAFFVVNGKTGTRRVRVVNSTPFLHDWLKHHPDKENKDAPLWCVIGTTKNISRSENNQTTSKKGRTFNWSFALTYPAARSLVIRAGKKAGIEKPINPHNFRHSRATSLGAAGLNESIMNQIMGWTQGSKMAGVYIHLSGKQCDDALLPALYGMKVEEDKKRQPKMFPIKCISCGELNEYNAKRCKKCNTIIGVITKEDINESSYIKQIEDRLKKLEKTEVNYPDMEHLADKFDKFIKFMKLTGGLNKKQLEQMKKRYEESQEDLRFEKQFKHLSPVKRREAIKFLEKEIRVR